MEQDPSSMRQRRTPAEKKRMVAQVVAHERREQREKAVLYHLQDRVLTDLIAKYTRVLGVLALITTALILYYRPAVFFERRERLPMRHFVTLLPEAVAVKRALPRFFQNYAIANDQNLNARRILQEFHKKRRYITDTGRLKQGIMAHAWEHVDFERQLMGETMDNACGQGFRALYYDPSAAQLGLRDDLVYWCLLASQTHDAFFKYELRPEASLTRGVSGVAVRYADGTPRIHASVLSLPISKEAPQPGVPPERMSTVAIQMLHWLLKHREYVMEGDYRTAMEEFLYQLIAAEDDANWVFLQAACTAEDRARLGELYRRVATECPADPVPDESTCCAMYDPNIKKFKRRVVGNDAD